MEFFEKAHVAKCAAKKDSKSEETVKKQLKQMLYGYKKNDNDIIKSSSDIRNNSDDSSSVSGFSDLNLTESTCADDTTRATIGSLDDADSIPEDINTDISPKMTDLSLNSDSEILSHDSKDSTSIDVSSENIHLENDSLESGLEDEELSLISSSLESFTDTESSQEFDSDGLLALKIHEKLRNKEPKQLIKRKLEKDESKEEEVLQRTKVVSKSKKNKLSMPPKILHPGFLVEDSIASDSLLNNSATETAISKLSMVSPPYISIDAAAEIQDDFCDVFGKYKHPIIKNIPYDNNALIFSDTAQHFHSDELMTDDERYSEDKATTTLESHVHSGSVVDETEENQIGTRQSSPDLIFEESTENIADNLPSEGQLNTSENIQEDAIQLFFIKNVCVCVMKHPAKLYMNGKFKVHSLGGTVEVFGHRLTEKPNEIYAPNLIFSQCLSTVENDNIFYGLFSKITTLGLSVDDAESIVTTIGEYDAVVVIQPLKSEKFDFVEQHFTPATLFNKSIKYADNCHAKALERLGCSIYLSQPRRVFDVPFSWQEVNKYCFKEQSRGILCGGKGVGKSTFLRYHVNRLLTQGPVLVIDLDIGQSEFTVAGNISASVVQKPLLGPNFTHLKKPERTLNLGMINALDNMRRYVNAVARLIAYCASDERLRGMRWVVNTMGLCNDVGLHFITIIILHCQPTYLLQIDSKNVKRRFDMFLRPQLVAAHYEHNKNTRLFANTTCPDNLNYGFVLSHHTESPVRINPFAPRDERYLNYLAYFSELLQIHKVPSLLDIAPYEVQLQDLCVYMNVKIPEGTVQQVLNGKIVALCQHEPGSVTKKTYVLADEPLLCHGHGLIRGIDFEKGILYVITPMSSGSLQVVDTLLYADWVPELRGLEARLPAGTAVPYRMQSMYQQKQLMFTPRRRFNPLQLIKMSRGS